MNFYSPGGLGWHDYHAYRIFNSIEYLKLNSYFSDYGFSIWTSCHDCDLKVSTWREEIYLSQPALLHFWPYIVVNHLFGVDAVFFLGPIIDKLVVFFTAVLISELFVRYTCGVEVNNNPSSIQDFGSRFLPAWWLGTIVFTVYISSIWSYQMQRAMWNEIWFFFFFSLSISALLRRKFIFGCFFIFIAGLMHYLSGFVLAIVFLSFGIFSAVYREHSVFISFMAPALHQYRRLWLYCLCALLPSLLYLALRALYESSPGYGGIGSSLLWRIGISGDDLHNGSIIGALQFLGGIRVSQCLSMLGTEGLQTASLVSKIAAFNCSLSVLGMVLLSSLSVLGAVWLLRARAPLRPLLLPVVMILIVTVALLQQSFSVHLLGHSYPFAIVFACGLAGLCLKAAEVIRSRSLSLIVLTPAVVGCVLLSIRVSMLSSLPQLH